MKMSDKMDMQIKLERFSILKENSGETKIVYDLSVPVCLSKIVKERQLYVTYPSSAQIADVPESVLVIPFVGVMLSVGCLFDCKVAVKKLDAHYASCLAEVEDSYTHYMPGITLPYRVYTESLEENNYDGDRCSLFFTGGVDATSALASVIDEAPMLINIQGGDIPISDVESHNQLEKYLATLCARFGLDYCFIQSNAREMFDESILDRRCREVVSRRNNHGWWASIAHVFNMVSLIAPYTYAMGITTHYLGSGYSKSDVRAFDANNPYQTNAIGFAACKTVLVDEDLYRTQKVAKVIRFQEKTQTPLELKVCWYREAGKNCSRCEKCYRTIMEIVVNEGDPNKLGFKVDRSTFTDMKKYLGNNLVSKQFWPETQEMFCRDTEKWSKDDRVSWFLDMRFNTIRTYAKILKRRITQKLK